MTTTIRSMVAEIMCSYALFSGRVPVECYRFKHPKVSFLTEHDATQAAIELEQIGLGQQFPFPCHGRLCEAWHLSTKPPLRSAQRKIQRNENVMERDSGRCQICYEPAVCVTRIVPRSCGGSSGITNLIASCRGCELDGNGFTGADLAARIEFIMSQRIPL